MAKRGSGIEEHSASSGRSGGADTSLSEEWAVTTSGQPQHSVPAVGSEHIYVGGLDPTVSALESDTGNVAWEFERAGSLSDSSPAVVGGVVYIGSGGGVLYALSEASLDETRYFWDSSETTLWLRVVTHPEKANEFGTLPFRGNFGLPVKRSRDNGVQFE